LTKVQLNYPDEVKRKHLEGNVVLHAIISTDGTVKEVSVISGPQELRQSALDAVSSGGMNRHY
jgi:periplasmic protein TonB